MVFPYEEYFEALFLIPSVFLLAELLLSLVGIKQNIANLRNAAACKNDLRVCLRHLVEPVVSVVGFVAFLCVFSAQLRYGIPVMFDRNAAPLTVTGQVEAIESGPQGVRFHYGGHQERGDLLTVDGKTYYLITSGDLLVGDWVELSYLPASKAVLHCTQLGGE